MLQPVFDSVFVSVVWSGDAMSTKTTDVLVVVVSLEYQVVCMATFR